MIQKKKTKIRTNSVQPNKKRVKQESDEKKPKPRVIKTQLFSEQSKPKNAENKKLKIDTEIPKDIDLSRELFKKQKEQI